MTTALIFFWQPVHASGRYYRNSLIEILVDDFGYTKCYREWRWFGPLPSHALTGWQLSTDLTDWLQDWWSSLFRQIAPDSWRWSSPPEPFAKNTLLVSKVDFHRKPRPAASIPWSLFLILIREEIVCGEPLLTVDRQMGLNIVHPEGKVCDRAIGYSWQLLLSLLCSLLKLSSTWFGMMKIQIAALFGVCPFLLFSQGIQLTYLPKVGPLLDDVSLRSWYLMSCSLAWVNSTSASGTSTILRSSHRERPRILGAAHLGEWLLKLVNKKRKLTQWML